MLNSIQTMLELYECTTPSDYRNALKEIIQEIVLLGLSRSGFFQDSAFYGGTALRIFYKLNRFSEDLDFSLLKENRKFRWNEYLPFIRNELESFGFDLTIEPKEKSFDSQAQGWFLAKALLTPSESFLDKI